MGRVIVAAGTAPPKPTRRRRPVTSRGHRSRPPGACYPARPDAGPLENDPPRGSPGSSARCAGRRGSGDPLPGSGDRMGPRVPPSPRRLGPAVHGGDRRGRGGRVRLRPRRRPRPVLRRRRPAAGVPGRRAPIAALPQRGDRARPARSSTLSRRDGSRGRRGGRLRLRRGLGRRRRRRRAGPLRHPLRTRSAASEPR